MPHVVGLCTRCQLTRYRTHRDDYEPGGTPPKDPAEFEALDGQPEGKVGALVVCSRCGGQVAFRLLAPTDGDPAATATVRPRLAPRNGATATAAAAALGVTELFAARAGEDVTSMRELGRDRILVVTTKRIVVVDLGALAGALPEDL